MQTAQQMVGVSGIGILIMGLVIIIVLLVIGLREKEDMVRRVRFLRAVGIIFGAFIIIMELLWYGTVVTTTDAPMTFEDVLIITGISSIGGLISGISCYIPIGR